jgi:peptidoglycan lytic transglycosylase
MHPDGYRPARNSDLSSPPRRRARWGVGAILALAVLAAGAIPAAQAATGGAAPNSPPTASASDGEGLAFTPLRIAGASWYGPGLYGRHTACGETLRPNTIGVAHKRLPCGTVVKFVFHGHTLITQVIDRGPYVRGRAWDLTTAASEALGFQDVGVGRVRYAVAREYARSKP